MRIAFVAWLVALGFSSACAAPQAPDGGRYPALFEAVWRAVDENFYDPGFHGVNWRAVGERYRARLGGVNTDPAFSRLANAMLDELHASHLFLSQPIADRALGGVGIGAETEQIGKDLAVIAVAPLSDAQRRGLRVGDRILSPPAALTGPLGAEATIAVAGCDGARRTLQLRHEAAYWPPEHPGFQWRQIAIRPGLTLGYIRITRFDDGAAELADQAMSELKDAQGVVIDVRDNSGGNLSALRLVGYFAGPSKAAVALLARPYLAALGHPVSHADIARLPATRGAYTNAAVFKTVKDGGGAAVYWTEDMGPQRYRGPVAVVMDENTGSAGEGFAGAMRDLAGATLIGRPTMGYLLSSDRFPLAGGWTLTIPVQGDWAGDGRDIGDRKVEPDIPVPRAAADLCRADDADLDRAVHVLEAASAR